MQQKIKDAIMPHLRENLGKYGGALTTDMWTDKSILRRAI